MRRLKHCQTCVPLWLSVARLESESRTSGGSINTARAILEKARMLNPGAEMLWLTAVQLESKADNKKAATQLLSRGLKGAPVHSPSTFERRQHGMVG